MKNSQIKNQLKRFHLSSAQIKTMLGLKKDHELYKMIQNELNQDLKPRQRNNLNRNFGTLKEVLASTSKS